MPNFSNPLDALRYHVSGAIERGEAQPISAIETLPAGYLALGGGWSYAPLRVGLSLRAPSGAEVYFQPGGDEAAARETIDALGEIEDDAARARVADIAFGDYFG